MGGVHLWFVLRGVIVKVERDAVSGRRTLADVLKARFRNLSVTMQIK